MLLDTAASLSTRPALALLPVPSLVAALSEAPYILSQQQAARIGQTDCFSFSCFDLRATRCSRTSHAIHTTLHLLLPRLTLSCFTRFPALLHTLMSISALSSAPYSLVRSHLLPLAPRAGASSYGTSTAPTCAPSFRNTHTVSPRWPGTTSTDCSARAVCRFPLPQSHPAP